MPTLPDLSEFQGIRVSEVADEFNIRLSQGQLEKIQTIVSTATDQKNALSRLEAVYNNDLNPDQKRQVGSAIAEVQDYLKTGDTATLASSSLRMRA